MQPEQLSRDLDPVLEVERESRMALSCVADAGDVRIAAAVQLAGAQAVWAAIGEQRDGSAFVRRVEGLDLARVRGAGEDCGARFVIPGDDEWPTWLEDLDNAEPLHERGGAPLGLWVRGSLPLNEAHGVSIVGSRAATSYGARVASDLAADLTADGLVIISGGAFGIDAAAHRGCLAEGGRSVAVLAGGVDDFYPRAHRGLFTDLLDHGGLLVSELAPGEHPTRIRFLARNRLIAALGQALVLVEAAARSGARNTVSWAANCGRPIGAVPGPVSSSLSVGPHATIRDGRAVLVSQAAHVTELIGGCQPELELTVRGTDRPRDSWSAERTAVYEVLPSRGGADVSTISVKSGFGVAACLAELAEQELLGIAERSDRGLWRVARPRLRSRRDIVDT